jgi:hypothetical protein
VKDSPSPGVTPKVDPSPEEPDFAFISGGPYTQIKNSFQLIFPNHWGRRRSSVAGGILHHAEFGSLTRAEWGITDRWEFDVVFGAEGERDVLGERKLVSDFYWADTMVGVRYRLLREASAPFTLTMGPQFMLPTGNLLRGTGFEKAGYGWEITGAKDWGGPVFVVMSLDYALFPSVQIPDPTSSRHFNLQNMSWATALGLRPWEKDRGTSHHDIHLFLEYGLGREEGLERGNPITKVSDTLSVVAPGVRYGFLTRRKDLFEIGVSIPLGITQSTPRTGVIFQIQFERILGFRGK